jgi:hypothetical protein
MVVADREGVPPFCKFKDLSWLTLYLTATDFFGVSAVLANLNAEAGNR